ncbi:hypothetical protein BD780_001842 [Clostridium tetanomorphum]|uniref:Zn-finger domain-containing protein n=1 Tax=Clostridium tetanomorphum TaxID=1553 RepID=A0A923EB42_CLOTT|nr:hypothetical protein [Clostridium tetanomorphum]KAJ52525.1 hypothetical protein CTM_07546 [Clostridium tetanomorphum DSM 665]MBC2399795.1 hypothetical protein [Clostridium tetanomorphum]MBP1864204.1 hypothetical protein [Clostridium tetanomorphum]NRS84617.1 hypothetical protein [Clostridium tetanomorphum]NRZ97832.1 hypothetical protein [Clostridium tetanomorphum]
MSKYKYCILNNNKSCNDCGECDICDLDKNKKCTNCGNCLNGSFDMRGVKIDEILEEEDNDVTNYEEIPISKDRMEFVGDESLSKNFDEENIELIDDIEGLRELLENQEKSEKFTYEEFPGLIRIRKEK